MGEGGTLHDGAERALRSAWVAGFVYCRFLEIGSEFAFNNVTKGYWPLHAIWEVAVEEHFRLLFSVHRPLPSGSPPPIL